MRPPSKVLISALALLVANAGKCLRLLLTLIAHREPSHELTTLSTDNPPTTSGRATLLAPVQLPTTTDAGQPVWGRRLRKHTGLEPQPAEFTVARLSVVASVAHRTIRSVLANLAAAAAATTTTSAATVDSHRSLAASVAAETDRAAAAQHTALEAVALAQLAV